MVINASIVPTQTTYSMAWVGAKSLKLRVGDASETTPDDGLTIKNIEPAQDVFHIDMDAENSGGNGSATSGYQRRSVAEILNDASSFNHARQLYLDKLSQVLKQMQDLAWRAKNVSLSQEDRAKSAEEFAGLAKSMGDVAEKEYGSVKLFDGSARQIGSLNMTLEGVDLARPAYTRVVRGDLSTAEAAHQASKSIDAALRQLTSDRQIVETSTGQLNVAASNLFLFTDSQEASEAMKSAMAVSEEFIQNSEQAMQAQANASLDPHRTLQLLWQKDSHFEFPPP
jgi:hypothetical protein